MKRFIFLALLATFSFSIVNAQGSYKVVFEGTDHTLISSVDATPHDEFIAIKFNYPFVNSSKVIYSDIYSFSNFSPDDSVHWDLYFNRNDSALTARSVYFEPDGGYLLSGIGVNYSFSEELTIHSRFNWMMRLDDAKNVMWEKMFPLPEEIRKTSTLSHFNFLTLKSGNYLFAETTQNDSLPWIVNILLKEIGREGDVLQYKVFDQSIGGEVMSLCYNHDSSAVMLHKMGWDLYDCKNGTGAFLLDTVHYDTIGSVCYDELNESFGSAFEAMVNSDGNLFVAGRYDLSWPEPRKEYLGIKRYDTSYQLTHEAFLTDPDTLVYGAWSDCLDINDQGEICVAGSFDNALGFFTDYYDLVYIAKLDPDLNLISERYIGRDAEYNPFSIAATSDGGIAVGGYQYDYLVNEDYEGDAFIIKTDGGLWLDTPQVSEENVHRALVFPNPGSENLNLRTSIKQAIFSLYNLQGKVLLQQNINQLITTVFTGSLPSGAYWWTLTKNGQLSDKGKWVKF